MNLLKRSNQLFKYSAKSNFNLFFIFKINCLFKINKNIVYLVFKILNDKITGLI